MNIDGKIRLYHFTRFDAFRQIMADGKILRGPIATSKHMPRAEMVCLTSDEHGGAGHGLPDGRQISPALAQQHQLYQVVRGRAYLLDALAVRLAVLVDRNDPKLYTASFLYKDDPALLDRLECAGHFPEKMMTEEDRRSVSFAFLNGDAAPMADTWYYYSGEIPFAGEDVAFRGMDDVYFYLPSTCDQTLLS